jgi:hypothetical protein
MVFNTGRSLQSDLSNLKSRMTSQKSDILIARARQDDKPKEDKPCCKGCGDGDECEDDLKAKLEASLAIIPRQGDLKREVDVPEDTPVEITVVDPTQTEEPELSIPTAPPADVQV